MIRRFLAAIVLSMGISTFAFAEDSPKPAEAPADVTAVVTKAVANNALTISVENDSLGGDPAPGIEKVLLVEYKVGEEKHTKQANEGSTLTIEKPDGERKLEVVKATYGPMELKNRVIDVKDVVVKSIADGKISLVVNNETMGSDPASGILKQLRVKYLVNGAEHVVVTEEGETLNLPAEADGAGKLEIKEAKYGELSTEEKK